MKTVQPSVIENVRIEVEDLLSRELDVLENAIGDNNKALAICSREKVWKLIDQIITLAQEEKEHKIIELQNALTWCSGSEDFQVGGKARKGWERIVHLITD